MERSFGKEREVGTRKYRIKMAGHMGEALYWAQKEALSMNM